MLRSMTGFGRGSAVAPHQDGAHGASATVVVEVKTVNHKGLDVKLRLPRPLHAHEIALVQLVKTRLERGRIDIAVDVEFAAASAAFVDEARVAAVIATAQALAKKHPEVRASFDVADLLKIPGVMATEAAPATDTAALEAASSQALALALDALDESRRQEGAGLQKELETRRQTCQSLVDVIDQRTSLSSTEKRAKLQEKLTTLLGEHADPQRLAAEAAVLVERLDVSEELARLRLHLAALDQLLQSNAPGRKLDFLCQELMREANTTASKCQDAETAQRVVDLKAEIERLREQAQNIE